MSGAALNNIPQILNLDPKNEAVTHKPMPMYRSLRLMGGETQVRPHPRHTLVKDDGALRQRYHAILASQL